MNNRKHTSLCILQFWFSNPFFKIILELNETSFRVLKINVKCINKHLHMTNQSIIIINLCCFLFIPTKIASPKNFLAFSIFRFVLSQNMFNRLNITINQAAVLSFYFISIRLLIRNFDCFLYA